MIPYADESVIKKAFIKYATNKRRAAISLPGFITYMGLKLAYPSSLIAQYKRYIKQDRELNDWLRDMIEGHMVDAMLEGTIKEGASKFVLKNHFNYKDTIEQAEATQVQRINIIVPQGNEEARRLLDQQNPLLEAEEIAQADEASRLNHVEYGA